MAHHARIPHQFEASRSSSCTGGAAPHFVVLPHHELPPLRAASLLGSRGSSRLQASPVSKRGDVFYDNLSVDSKAFAPLGAHSSSRAAAAAGRLALVHLEAVRREVQDESRLTPLHEIESLKRQVSRLTQLRRDRDSYIQDLLADAEATQRRHEGELARRTARDQKVVGEQLSGQQREHDARLEERTRAHAAALAQQVIQHEQELSELRRALRSEGERRLAERVAELSTESEQTLARCSKLVVQLLERLTQHAEALAGAGSAGAIDGVCGSGRFDLQEPLVSFAPSDEVHEPEPEEAESYAPRAGPAVLQDLHSARGRRCGPPLAGGSAQAARGGAPIAAAAVEQALEAAKAQLERAIAASQRGAVRQARALRNVSGRIALAHAQRHAAAVLFWWAAATREARREAAHRHRLLALAADSSSELYRLRNESKRVAVELRRQRRAHGVAAIHASLDRRLQAVVHAWLMVARDAQRESIYQRQLDIAAAESAASCAVLRMEGRRTALELRHQRRTQALRSIRSNIRHVRHAVLYAWSVVVADEHREMLLVQELGLASEKVEAAQTEAARQALLRSAMGEAHAAAASRLRDALDLSGLLAAWRRAAAGPRGEAPGADLRLRALRWGARATQVLDDSRGLLTTSFLLWRLARLEAGRRRDDGEGDEAEAPEAAGGGQA